MRSFTFTVFSLTNLLTLAVPSGLKRAPITELTTPQISFFKPYSYYASTAYCNPSSTINWSCGPNCEANSGFKTVASGGDGDSVQYWFVGYDPSLQTVVIAHQGTDFSKLEPALTDADFFLEQLDPTLFPNIPSKVEVHNGFGSEQAKTAQTILSAVKTAMNQFGAKKVTVVGHSLGGALALIDSVYLPLHLPGDTSFQTITYGMPRVGNQEFADYVDTHVTHLTHINNKQDPVPILPGMFLGFHHPSGEVHIQDDNSWVSCPGQDNADERCSVGGTLESDPKDHDGPYDGVTMEC